MLDFIRYWFFYYDYTDSTFSTWLLREGFEVYKVDLLAWSNGFHFLLYVSCCVVVEINVLLYLADFIDKGGFKFMKQKIIPFICICMVVILSVPSVPALADAYLIPGIVTTDSLSGYSFNFPDADAWSGYIPGVQGNEGEGYKFSHFYDQELAFPVTNTTFNSRNFSVALSKLSDLNIDLENYYYALCTTYNANLYVASLFLIPKSGGYFEGADVFGTYKTFTGNGPGGGTSGFCVYNADIPSDVTSLPITYYNITLSGSNWGNWQMQTSTLGRTFVNNSNNVFFFSFNSIGNIYNLLYSNMDFILLPYVQWDNVFRDVNNTVLIPTVTVKDFCTYYITEHRYQKGSTGWFNLAQAPYYNGTEVITPSSGEETNANHMYFTKCDFGFCEPANVNSFTNFGGAYFYIDYDVDQWVKDHISDYKIEFHVDCYVGSDHYSFTTHKVLDPDMCLTIPFSYFDGFNYGFSSYVTNQRIDSTFLKSYLYCVSPSSYSTFYNKISSGSFGGSLSNALNNLIYSSSGSSGVLVYTTPSASTVITSSILTQEFLTQLFYNNTFEITCSAKLQDNDSNESGSVIREFDLVRGSSTSKDNSGLTNEDPYVSDDDDDGYLPTLPEYTGTGTTSSNGQITVNNNMPGKLDVTIDNGFNQFMETYNSSSEVQTAQNGFWGSFGLFKDNPATTLYSQYFGFLPDGFKEIVLGGACIGIIGGAFAALRKKLT